MLLLVVFFALATGSLLIPVPEELLVGIVGFSAMVGAESTPQALGYMVVALIPCCVAVVCGDAIIWFLGLRLGLAARARFRFLARAATDARVTAVERALSRYGALAIMIARLVPGARICTFFVAGSMRMPFSRFVLFDFFGSLLSVSLCLALGALAAHKDYGASWAREAAGSAACIASICLLLAALIVWGMLALFKGAAKTPSREVEGLLDADSTLSVAPPAEFLTQD